VGQIALGGLENRFSREKTTLSLDEGQRSARMNSWVVTLGETYVDDRPIEELEKSPARGIGHYGGA
jgi:hypothetical protein